MAKQIKIYPVVIFVLFFNLILSVCQATPEAEAVVQKGEAQMETIMDSIVETEEETNKPLLPSKPYDFPEHLSYTLTTNNDDMAEALIEVDADVIVPEYAAPIYNVTSKKIDAQTVIDLMDYLRNSQPVYYRLFADAVMTKVKYQEQIDYYLHEISMCTGEYASMRPGYEKIVKGLYEDMADAPESYSVFTKASIDAERRAQDAEIEDSDEKRYEFEEFDANMVGEVTMTEALYRSADRFSFVFGESRYSDTFYFDNDAMKTKQIQYTKNYPDRDFFLALTDIYQIEDMPIALDFAKTQAEPIVKMLDDSLTLSDVMPLVVLERGEAEDGTDYQIPIGIRLVYTRTFNGVGSNYSDGLSWYIGDSDDSETESYVEPYGQEYLRIDVSEKGIEAVEYVSPMSVVQMEGQEAELLPFEDIQRIFDAQISVNNRGSDSEVYVSVEKAELGMARIAVPNEKESYLVVPVWDFYGNSLLASKGKGYTSDALRDRVLHKYGLSLLTINAIDGSVIDRQLGY